MSPRSYLINTSVAAAAIEESASSSSRRSIYEIASRKIWKSILRMKQGRSARKRDPVPSAPLAVPILHTRRERGSTILEQALVYPVLLGIIVASVDITRVLQGYSVLDQGLRSALRCVSTANGECISTESSAPDARFNVYERISIPRYRVQQHSYTGEASWLTQPVHEITSITAAVLTSARYSVPQHSYRYGLDLFRPRGTIGYGVELRSFPYIDANPTGPLVPVVNETRGSNRAAAAVFQSARNITLRHTTRPSATAPSVRTGQVTFTIPRTSVVSGEMALTSDERCFQLDASGAVDFNNRCGSENSFVSPLARAQIRSARNALGISELNDRSEFDQVAFIVLDIRGAVSSSANTTGAVTLRLSQQGGVTRNLGGRLLSGVGPANFIPRGAPTEAYSATLRGRYPDEVREHQAILVRLGVPITVDFELLVDNAADPFLEWRLSSLSVYAPTYQGRVGTAECGSLTSRPRFESNPIAACGTSRHPAGLPRSATLFIPERPEEQSVQTLCLAVDARDGNAELERLGVPDAQFYRPLDPGVGGETCGTAQRNIQCPTNKGVAGLSLTKEGNAREVCNSALAHSQCPIPAGGDLSNSCWLISPQSLTFERPARWVRESCEQYVPKTNQLPTISLQYPERFISSVETAEVQRLYTGPLTPAEYKSRNPGVACSDFAIEVQDVGINLDELKPESLFRSRASLGADFRQLLFTDAQINFIDPANNVDPRAHWNAAEGVSSVVADAPPDNPRQIYWIEEETSDWVPLANNILQNEMPSPCLAEPSRCRTELVSRTPSILKVAPVSRERAAAVGYAAVQAAMPSLQLSCAQSSQSCAQIELEEQQDTRGTVFVARGEVRVPLMLSPQPYVIAQRAQARWERDLVAE
jgi:hypothetical protein